ncbi:hypothetical protein [Luteibacter yeojuensis]|uniref:Uncharacterized protein n=1 Tax=Luteibacter yeojuensis TaxID=345309 RepID=A0A7X5QU19_9GAMM|nr:hypothetical protein [Luteibacter yeojuensis]NID15433.1 hypothetical protein [Luteibacter yeojuensis]
MSATFFHRIGEAVEAACRDLPDGYIIELALERGAAVPTLYDPDGEQISPEVGNGLELPDEIADFVVLANAHAAGEKAKAVQS